MKSDGFAKTSSFKRLHIVLLMALSVTNGLG